MSHQEIYPVPGEFEKNSLINDAKYQEMYKASIENPQEFWAQQAKELLDWESFPTKIMNADFHEAQIKWFEDGVLNVSYNCIDRHLEKKGDDVAIIWEGDDCNDSMHISYKELHKKVCQFANILRARGIKKGDRVAIYMPMIPEASYAMLACARIGAVHSVVFGGFSPEAIKARIQDSECAAVITADEGRRAGKRVPLKKNVDLALNDCPSIHTCLVVQSTGGEVIMQDGRDIWYHQALESASLECDPEPMNAEDPFFILYTSGSTGTPKGVLHTTGGYLLYATMTFKYVFDYHDGDVYWCTADVGWITGHSYLLYGPLSCGATTLMFEGVPDYPTPSRIWEVVDKHQVNVVYTAPTAIRALMRHGNDPVKATSRRSLRILGTVGEPINPEAWSWYYEVVGEERCPIVDTWWQTETGGHMITALPGATALKPGSATRPFFGVEPVILDGDGKELDGAADGYLMIKSSWPGQMRGIYGNHERFKETYFGMFPGYYLTGDSAKRDSDGYYWITGRIDDVMNVSGHRMGTAEVESALVLHPKIAEAAVVGFPHEIKGQGIYAYVTLMAGAKPSDELYDELVKLVRTEIGPIAKPDIIQWAPGLPKTRSGKIMRRILRKIAEDEFDSLGDTSTLADPSVIDYLVKQHKILKQIMLDKNKV